MDVNENAESNALNNDIQSTSQSVASSGRQYYFITIIKKVQDLIRISSEVFS